MMWNFLVGGLLTGSTIILYDGSPSYPDNKWLWRFAEQTKMTAFGTSASFLTASMKDNLEPGKEFDLTYLSNISSTGSPLPPKHSSGAIATLKTIYGLLLSAEEQMCALRLF